MALEATAGAWLGKRSTINLSHLILTQICEPV